MKYETGVLELTPSTKFQLNLSKNRKVSPDMDFHPQAKNYVITGNQW